MLNPFYVLLNSLSPKFAGNDVLLDFPTVHSHMLEQQQKGRNIYKILKQDV